MDESQTVRVSVAEAATLLGIEPASVKKRIQRGKLRSEKATSGTIYVYLDRSETVQDKSHSQSQVQSDLVEELRSRVAYLERQVEEEKEARRRADTIIASLAAKVPALEAPESHEEPAEQPASPPARMHQTANRTAPPVASEQRPWWRRMFGG